MMEKNAPLEFALQPAMDRPKAGLVLAFGLGILLQALWQWLEPLTALMLFAVLLFSLRDIFLPTVTVFDAEGITVRGPMKPLARYPWSRFRAYQVDRNGLFLSPYLQKRSTEGQRGVFLALTREQMVAAMERCEAQGLLRRSK